MWSDNCKLRGNSVRFSIGWWNSTERRPRIVITVLHHKVEAKLLHCTEQHHVWCKPCTNQQNINIKKEKEKKMNIQSRFRSIYVLITYLGNNCVFHTSPWLDMGNVHVCCLLNIAAFHQSSLQYTCNDQRTVIVKFFEEFFSLELLSPKLN
jgi:hypothetical protein